jgi:hypothetical protein
MSCRLVSAACRKLHESVAALLLALHQMGIKLVCWRLGGLSWFNQLASGVLEAYALHAM